MARRGHEFQAPRSLLVYTVQMTYNIRCIGDYILKVNDEIILFRSFNQITYKHLSANAKRMCTISAFFFLFMYSDIEITRLRETENFVFWDRLCSVGHSIFAKQDLLHSTTYEIHLFYHLNKISQVILDSLISYYIYRFSANMALRSSQINQLIHNCNHSNIATLVWKQSIRSESFVLSIEIKKLL